VHPDTRGLRPLLEKGGGVADEVDAVPAHNQALKERQELVLAPSPDPFRVDKQK